MQEEGGNVDDHPEGLDAGELPRASSIRQGSGVQGGRVLPDEGVSRRTGSQVMYKSVDRDRMD